MNTFVLLQSPEQKSDFQKHQLICHWTRLAMQMQQIKLVLLMQKINMFNCNKTVVGR